MSVFLRFSASPPKRSPVKRRRNSQRFAGAFDSQGKSMPAVSSVGSVGSDIFSGGNDQRSTHPSSSSEFNSPMSSPSPFPAFAVPLTRAPSASAASTVLVDNRSTVAVSTTVPSLVRPPPEPTNGDLSPEALRWRAWKAIAMEDIPKVSGHYHCVMR